MVNRKKYLNPISKQPYNYPLEIGFGDPMTVVEKINTIVNMLNDYGEINEKMLEKWNEVYKWVTENGIDESVVSRIKELIDDGTLKNIISKELLNDIHVKIKENKKRIEDMFVSVLDFGAIGNGFVDDTINIQKTIDYVGENGGGTVLFPPGKNFLITSKIKVTYDNVTLQGNGSKLTYDNSVGSALQLGKNTGSTRYLGYSGLKIENKSKMWGHNTTGLEVTSVVWSNLKDIDVEGFKKGIHFNSFSGGCAYNQITLSRVFDNETNVLIDPKGVNGWVNENTFYGGNLSVSSSRNTNERKDATNVLITKGTNSIVNNNRFFSTCFEGAGVRAIDCDGLYNVFYSCRYEGSVEIVFSGNSNSVVYGRGLRKVNFTDTGSKNHFLSSDSFIINGGTFDSKSGTIDARNSSSVLNKVFVARDPLRETVFSVDGRGVIQATRIETKEKPQEIEMSRNRKIVFGIGEPKENLPTGSLYIDTGATNGKTLWVKENPSASGWASK